MGMAKSAPALLPSGTQTKYTACRYKQGSATFQIAAPIDFFSNLLTLWYHNL